MSDKVLTIGVMPEYQKKFCSQIMEKIWRKKISHPFTKPLPNQNPLEPSYKKIDHPMDLSIVQEKLNTGAYDSIALWARDVELVWSNAIHTLPPENYLSMMAQELQLWFKHEMRQVNSDGKAVNTFTPRFLEEKWLQDVDILKKNIQKIINTCPIKLSLIPDSETKDNEN